MIDLFIVNAATWAGICFCVSQSAMFSGLNLAVFSISRLQLEAEASTGNQDAIKVLKLREDSNFILTTILWGNVGINVLLTLFSNSVIAGVAAFLFSTVVITFIGEIFPQAYFSRNALKMASILSPVLIFYKILLYPVAKPVAKVLDWWLGQEGIQYFRENDFKEIIKKHIAANETDIEILEGTGAINFFDIDDLAVVKEGEPVDRKSIITLPFSEGMPVFPEIISDPSDKFLKQIQSSGKKWIIITDISDDPFFVLDSDKFIISALFNESSFSPYGHCHKPIIVKDKSYTLGKVISQLKTHSRNSDEQIIENDIILVWGSDKCIITGSDILERLLRRIDMS